MGKQKCDAPAASVSGESGESRSDQTSIDPTSAGSQPSSSAKDIPRDPANKRLSFANGSWRGKATAVAGVARESITAAGSSSLANAGAKTTPAPPTHRRSSGLLTPTRSAPSTTSVSKVNAVFGTPETSATNDSDPTGKEAKEQKPAEDTEKRVLKEDAIVERQGEERPMPAAGWRGWWSRGADEKTATGDSDSTQPDVDGPQAGTEPLKKRDGDQTVEADTDNSESREGGEHQIKSAADVSLQRSSWFGLWGPSVDATTGLEPNFSSRKGESVEPSQSSQEAAAEPTIAPSERPKEEAAATQRLSSGSWSFWSRDSGIGSAADGKIVTESDAASATRTSPAKPEENGHKTTQPQSRDSTQVSQPDQKQAKQAMTKMLELSAAQSSRPVSVSEAGKDSQPTERSQDRRISKAMPPNLLLPAFHKTYHLAQTPSYWQQLIRMFGRHDPEEQRHLSIASSPPRIKNALAIGIHGYFPSPIVQKVLGPPTGTSIRFAKSAAASIKKWTEANNQTCDIEMVALEGEGMITSRLDSLWKLLLNWVEQIRKADFILVACHSQGVPVACLLVERLINFGVLSANVRIGICAMAGVNLGPFASYRSRFLDAAASELFSFSQPGSTVSRMYASAVETLLAHHVRITYVGSIDDQLVSMESSTFSNISHPYIYRAVFVDGRIHAPDFLTHLVGFALKLRNLGIPDHGLVRELSGPLAGSLYSGEGHSRIYHEQGVYDLAVEFALETTSLLTMTTGDARGTTAIAVERVPYEVPAATPNPYFLPWAMRGLLEEEFVKTELKDEVSELLEQFESWKPQSKVLMDVRFRLEAVKSKL